LENITFQKILDSLNIKSIADSYQKLNIWAILISLAAAFIIVMFIYWIYKKTFSGVLYSKNFNVTLVIVSLVTTSAVIIISSNIVLALGMVGALSIVRFRMAVKDPRDVGFLFWAITNGIICGISAYSLAVISSLFIGLVVFLLSKKISVREPYLLILETKDLSFDKISQILDKYCYIFKLRSQIITGDKTELIIEVKLNNKKIAELISELKKPEAVKNIKLVSYQGDLEEG
jgi:uncharacterized membrane protein YhiD involved in acid resistance